MKKQKLYSEQFNLYSNLVKPKELLFTIIYGGKKITLTPEEKEFYTQQHRKWLSKLNKTEE